MATIGETTVGRATSEFKQASKAKLNDWFGEGKYEVLFQWYDDTVTYVCIRSLEREAI